MEYENKVEKFVEAIRNNETVRGAILEASKRWGLNAAWFGDAQAWSEANDITGWKYNEV